MTFSLADDQRLRDVYDLVVQIKTSLEHAEKWRDISTAPKDGNTILLYPSTWGRVFEGRYVKGVWRHVANALELVDQYPTHWLPLPDLPGKPGEPGKQGRVTS